MAPTRAQRTSLAVAVVLALAFLWGAVLQLERARERHAEAGAALARENSKLTERLTRARADAVEAGERGSRQADLLAKVDQARVVAEEQRAAARHGLYLAHMEAASSALSTGRLDDFDRHAALVPAEHRGWAFGHLDLVRHRTVVTLPAHADDVTALACSPHRFASAARDGLVRVWRAPPAEPHVERELLAAAEVSSLAFDATGERLGIGTDAGDLWIHELGAEAEPTRVTFQERVTALAFVPGSRHILVGLFDGTTWTWDGRAAPTPMTAHGGPINAIAIAADGRLAATASDDELVRLHTGAGFTQSVALAGHTDWVRSLAFDASTRRLASGSEDRSVRVWDTASGTLVSTTEQDDSILAVRFLSGGELATVSALGAAPGVRLPLPADLYVEQAAIAPDGGWLVFSTGGPEVLLWRAAPGGARALQLPSAPRSVAARGDAGTVAVGLEGGFVRLLEVATGRLLFEWPGEEEGAPRVALSPDGRHVAAGDTTGVRVWDADSGALLRAFTPPVDRVHDVALSELEDGRWVTAVVNDGGQWAWSLATGELLHASARAPGFLFLARADTGARRFAWVGDAGTVRVWDVLDGRRLSALRERTLGRVEDLDLGRDGTRLVLVCNDREVVAFDLEQSRMLARTRRAECAFRSVALHPSGACFVTGSLDGALVVWDTSSATPLLELAPAAAAVTDVAFSADGTWLVAASADGSLRFFEAALR